MPSIEYSLFRAKFTPSKQPPLFPSSLTTEQIFVQALEEKPSAEPREGHHWHIAIFNCSRKEQDTLRVAEQQSQP